MTSTPDIKNDHSASRASQLYVVTKYETLKLLRSRRLLWVILGSLVLVTVAFVLPTTYGGPYAGHREATLNLEPYSSDQRPEYRCVAFLSEKGLDRSSIAIHVNGTLLPTSEYYVSNDSSGAILFRSNLLLSEVVAGYDFSTSSEQFAMTLLDFMQLFVAFIAVFLGSDAIVREFAEHTGLIAFTNPVRREIMMLGKFVSGLLVGALALVVYYVALAGLSFAILGTVAEYLPLSLGFAILYCFFCLAFAFLVSSASKGIAPSVVLSFLVLLLVLPSVQMAGEQGTKEMWFLPSYAAGTMRYSLQFEHYPQDVTQGVQPLFYPDLTLSTVVLILYGTLSLLAGGYLFTRREMNS